MKTSAMAFKNPRIYVLTIVSLAVMAVVTTGVLYLVLSFPPALNISNMFHAPIESIPFDGGWIGLVLIFGNGFMLSYVLAANEVDITERLLLAIGLGFGLTFVVMILIGVLWEFSLSTVALTHAILLGALVVAAISRVGKTSFKGFWQTVKTWRMPQLNVLAKVSLIVVSIFSIVAVYKTVSLPATEWDSLAYGVNYAKIIFERGNIPLIAGPSIGLEMSASYPPGVQLTAVFLYEFIGNANDFYFRILSPIFGLATMLATYKFAIIANKNKNASIFAVFALSSFPFFWELFIQETYLMGLTLMLTLAALFFYKAYHADPVWAKKYEVIGTLFCCFSALTSYIGIFSFGLLLLYVINAKASLKRFVCIVAFALAVTVPWYVRNIVFLGNPIYPFFGVGKYLDPLLRSSTVQHFQNYLMIPLYGWTSAICKLGVGILFLAIAYFTFAKRKNFLGVSTFYLLLVGAFMMALHIPFPRYLIIALPCFAVFLSATVKWLLTMNNVSRFVVVPVLSVFIISSVVVLPYMNSSKPADGTSDDKWGYLSRVFEEADAWKWINENAPADARIATYDIKEYYLERSILPLDGNESAPLYEIDTIEEGIAFLQDKRITYVLSVPWASPPDPRLPAAYEMCVLTKYLGDPRYLPPVYVGLKGTTVYHVGPVDERTKHESFAKKGFAPPTKHVTINLTVTGNTYPCIGRIYMPVPVDYRGGKMVFSVSSCQSVDIELWNGLVPAEMLANPSGGFMFVKKWAIQSSNSSGTAGSSCEWQIDRAGYFTFRIVDREETLTEGFGIVLDLRFYNYWELKFL